MTKGADYRENCFLLRFLSCADNEIETKFWGEICLAHLSTPADSFPVNTTLLLRFQIEPVARSNVC